LVQTYTVLCAFDQICMNGVGQQSVDTGLVVCTYTFTAAVASSCCRVVELFVVFPWFSLWPSRNQ